MIHQLNMKGKDKVQTAIERLQTFEPPEGYYLAFSGGKDSVVIKALADMAGVKYDAYYHHTSVEPPELVRFVKEYHEDVTIEWSKDKNGNRITMWNLIPKKSLPPTRIARYCCQALKEDGGNGRMCVTGVRWAESPNRRKNQGEITIYKGNKKVIETLADNANFMSTPRGGVVLNNDNEESRKMVEQCYKLSKTVVNPIIDWDNAEVWEFIHEYKIPYCSLYDEGFKRLGCVGCPMGTIALRKREFERWPKFKELYMKAFGRALDHIHERGKETKWETAQDMFDWWLSC